MYKPNSLKRLLTATLAVCLALFSTSVFGQGVTTSGINGFVTDRDGKPVAAANVSILHQPSGTVTNTVTRNNGQYSVSGLRPGGPYTITITKGDEKSMATDISVGLDHPEAVDLILSAEQIQKLEAFQVSASSDTTFDSNKMGTATAYNSQQLVAVPSVRRDVQDVANLDTRVGLTLNTSTGEFSLSAQGQNSRFNSFLIDGQQANDPFGLNANGFSSLRSPIPLDWLSAMTIDLSPYDVTRTGFTGALVNAVTKSGSNEFHGSAYTFYTSTDLRGPNPGVSNSDPKRGTHDPLSEKTYGATFSGPIIKDKLFFFFGYEQWKKTGVQFSPVIFSPSAAAVSSIIQSLKAYNIDPGTLAGGTIDSSQKNYLGKLDWNISNDHRASISYRRTESSAPNYSNGSTYIQFSSNAYQANRISDNVNFILNSSWTPDLHTELAIGGNKYNGTASLYTPLSPAIYVNGVPGTNLVTGAAVTGQVDIGSNISYQLNSLFTKDYNGHLYGDYSMGDHTIKAGADFDKSINKDVFGQYYTGLYAFANPDALAAGTPNFLRYQQAITGGQDTVAAASYYYSYLDAGALLQDTWKPNANLTVTGGLRMDYPYYPTSPVYLPAFQTAFGIPNNSTGSGNITLAPRLGFSYKLPKDLTKWEVQVRGGMGLFQGTNPAVWVGNSYGTTGLLNTVYANGVTSNSSSTNPPLGPPYSPFNPSSGYVQTLPLPAIPTPSIALTDPNFRTPTSWKGNLAFDVKLPWWGLVFTAETNQLIVAEAINYQNLNLKPTGVLAPDGRILYSGSAGLHPNFSNSVLMLTNTDQGGSQSYTVGINRPMKDNWSFGVSYTHTHATEVQPLTSSVASSNYANRSVINPNDDQAHNSLYSVPDKFVASATRELHLFGGKDSATRITGVFRVQTGHAYSWEFFNDVNNDSSFNDALYVPTGPNDPKVAWADAAQKAAFFDFVSHTDLKNYMGQIVPPNSSYSPMQKTVDLSFEQDIPLHYSSLRLSLFATCLNFANLLSKSWGAVTGIDFATGNSGYARAAGNATIANGVYNYTFTGSNTTTPTVFTDLSRWQLQIGAKLEF